MSHVNSLILTMWPGALYTNANNDFNDNYTGQWYHSPITYTELVTWPYQSKNRILLSYVLNRLQSHNNLCAYEHYIFTPVYKFETSTVYTYGTSGINVGTKNKYALVNKENFRYLPDIWCAYSYYTGTQVYKIWHMNIKSCHL